MGIARLTRLDIRLFEEDEGIKLEPWERRAIFELDDLWLTAMQPDPKKQGEPQKGSNYVP